jgi:hypothetical protein
VENPDLKVADMGAMLLDDPDYPEREKERIRERSAAQKSFNFKNSRNEDVSIVIGRFRNGYDLWFVNLETGFAARV